MKVRLTIKNLNFTEKGGPTSLTCLML